MTDHRFISHLEVQLGCRKESRSDHFQVSTVNEAHISLLLRFDGKSWKTKIYFVYKIILCLLRENQTCLEKKSGTEEKHSRLAAVYQKILPLGKIHNHVIQKSCKSYYSKSQEGYICIFIHFKISTGLSRIDGIRDSYDNHYNMYHSGFFCSTTTPKCSKLKVSIQNCSQPAVRICTLLTNQELRKKTKNQYSRRRKKCCHQLYAMPFTNTPRKTRYG